MNDQTNQTNKFTKDRFPFVWGMLLLALFTSATLLYIFNQHYQDQKKMLATYQNHRDGAPRALELTKSLIKLKTSSDHQEDLENIKQILPLVDPAFKIPSTITDFFEFKISAADHIRSATRNTLDRYELILDKESHTYYVVTACYVWLPMIFHYNYSPKLQHLEQIDHPEKFSAVKLVASNYFIENYFKALQYPLFIQNDPTLKDDIDSYFRQIAATIKNDLQKKRLQANPNEVDLSMHRDQALAIAERGTAIFLKEKERKISILKSNLSTTMLKLVLFTIIMVLLIFKIICSVAKNKTALFNIIQGQEQALIRSEKLALLGEIAGSIGHDIKNPLSVIQIVSDRLLKMQENHQLESNPELTTSLLNNISRMVFRINDIINSMRSYIGEQDEKLAITQVDLKFVFSETKLLLDGKIKREGAEIIFKDETPAGTFITANESEVIQVFVNLVSNALDAVHDQKQKKVLVSASVNQNELLAYVSDNGPGVPKNIQAKIFEAFYTTKDAQHGTGLGLSICQKILHKYKGSINYKECPDLKGACFEIKIPITKAD